MDEDPPLEELDSFSLVLPLPYRLAFLILLGVGLWGINLHGLRLLKIVCGDGGLEAYALYIAKANQYMRI